MSFITMYDRIEARIKELVEEGTEKEEARRMAWEEFHNDIF